MSDEIQIGIEKLKFSCYNKECMNSIENILYDKW